MAKRIKITTLPCLLGIYPMGGRNVEVWAVEGNSGHFACMPDKDLAKIHVGIHHRYWQGCLAVLLHEALELAHQDLGDRYIPSPDYAEASDGYIFVSTHPKFGEAVARAAWLMAPVLPLLSDLYKRHNEKAK